MLVFLWVSIGPSNLGLWWHAAASFPQLKPFSNPSFTKTGISNSANKLSYNYVHGSAVWKTSPSVPCLGLASVVGRWWWVEGGGALHCNSLLPTASARPWPDLSRQAGLLWPILKEPEPHPGSIVLNVPLLFLLRHQDGQLLLLPPELISQVYCSSFLLCSPPSLCQTNLYLYSWIVCPSNSCYKFAKIAKGM